jgi:hypothetical protein
LSLKRQQRSVSVRIPAHRAYRLTGAPFSDSDEYVAAFDFHVEAPHFRVRIVW